MKMRKLFAILVASALLAALAIVPANAGYVATYTQEYTDFNTITGNSTPAQKSFEAGTVTAVEVVISVTTGSADIRYTKSTHTGACLQVRVNADGTYVIFSDSPSAGPSVRTVAEGTYSTEEPATVTYYVDNETNNAVFIVNGTETKLPLVAQPNAQVKPYFPAANLATSTTEFTHVAIYGVDTTAEFTVSSMKLGTVENTVIESGNPNVTVTVNPNNTDVTPATKSVDLQIGTFDFTYTANNIVAPNGTVLETEGSWNATSATIVATNTTEPGYEGEDVTIWVTASYTPAATGVDGVTFSLDNTEVNALAYEGTVTITGTLTGDPTDPSVEVNAQIIGTITVVVESVNPAAAA